MPSTQSSTNQKNVVITGGTSGIGLQTARQVVATGARVVIVGSDQQKGAAAQFDVEQAAGDAGGTALFIAADLSSMAGVHALASTISAMLDRVDVLIHNAGVVSQRRQVTSDGYERTFAINFLAPFALTEDLLPLLRASRSARVIALTAAVEPIGRLPFNDLQRVRHYGGLRAYAQSKKALALYMTELAHRLRDETITANLVDPFLVRTDLTSDRDVPLLFKLARPLMISPSTAARWVTRAATDPKLEKTTGRHVLFGRVSPRWFARRNHTKGTRLWDISLELVRS